MPPLTTVRWSGPDLAAHLDEALAVYGAAMGYPAPLIAGRRGFLAAHTKRRGFRAVVTLDAKSRVVGFCYGYRGEAGQWWHEHVRAGLPRGGYDRWLADCFEVVELHVLPAVQGRELGLRQLTMLLDGVNRRTAVLSTPEGESRAWRLYRRLGFADVLRHVVFPGDDRPFAVLGRDLPLPALDG